MRRPPAGTKAKSAHDMGREYRLQHALKPVFQFVPEMRIFCADESVVGAEFYVMERLNGIIPGNNLPRGLQLSADLSLICVTATVCKSCRYRHH
ncbi:phosphotransferase [Paraburkholderia sp. EG287A]|uniref:phosphotransferase n=1 Tax=unclassified Paraburkholderia TaxID=2615204 RepID=UPI0034D1658A